MNDKVKQELAALAATAEHGLLQPDAVWRWAQVNPESALYQEFAWDLQEAAEQAWTHKARRLICAWVTYSPQHKRVIRARVSVPTDRISGGGYRDTQEALQHPLQRAALLEGALAELRNFPKRHAHLSEMAPLWKDVLDAVDRFDAALRNQGESA